MPDLMSIGGAVINTSVNRDVVLATPVINYDDVGDQVKAVDRLSIRTSILDFDMLVSSDPDVKNCVFI